MYIYISSERIVLIVRLYSTVALLGGMTRFTGTTQTDVKKNTTKSSGSLVCVCVCTSVHVGMSLRMLFPGVVCVCACVCVGVYVCRFVYLCV
jgi:hypothetical protein